MTTKDPNFIDFDSPLEITGNARPHWNQYEKMQFVTFRLNDSIAASMRNQLIMYIESFKRLHPEPWDPDTWILYRKDISSNTEHLLHAGYGKCYLRNSKVRDIIAEALQYGNMQDYYLYAYVIMPNHLHILLQPIGDLSLAFIIRRMKSFTAKKINVTLNRRGTLWQRSYFDRMPRNKDDFTHILDYIQHNPEQLPPQDYTLYFDHSLIGQIL